MAVELAQVDKIIGKHEGQRRELIPILLDIQNEFHFLPREALERVAAATGLSRMHVFQVARFYRAFSFMPQGKHRVSVCLGTACHVRGSASLLQQLAQFLCIAPGQTTPDGRLSLETANCPGYCAVGPAVVIDGVQLGKMDVTQIERVLQKYAGEKEVARHG